MRKGSRSLALSFLVTLLGACGSNSMPRSGATEGATLFVAVPTLKDLTRQEGEGFYQDTHGRMVNAGGPRACKRTVEICVPRSATSSAADHLQNTNTRRTARSSPASPSWRKDSASSCVVIMARAVARRTSRPWARARIASPRERVAEESELRRLAGQYLKERHARGISF
jgi:hypothetical protein